MFFDKTIAEAKAKEKSDTGLSTDAYCIVDLAIQREGREGMRKMGREELVDELIAYVM